MSATEGFKYKGFTGTVSFVDNMWIGKIENVVNDVNYHGLTECDGVTKDELYNNFKDSIDEFLKYVEKTGVIFTKHESGIANVILSMGLVEQLEKVLGDGANNDTLARILEGTIRE